MDKPCGRVGCYFLATTMWATSLTPCFLPWCTSLPHACQQWSQPTVGTASGTVSQGKTSVPQIGFTECSSLGDMKTHTAAFSIGSLPLLSYSRGNVLLHSIKIHFSKTDDNYENKHMEENLSNNKNFFTKCKGSCWRFCALDFSLLKAGQQVLWGCQNQTSTMLTLFLSLSLWLI